jgi:hypothetical protein
MVASYRIVGENSTETSEPSTTDGEGDSGAVDSGTDTTPDTDGSPTTDTGSDVTSDSGNEDATDELETGDSTTADSDKDQPVKETSNAVTPLCLNTQVAATVGIVAWLVNAILGLI